MVRVDAKRALVGARARILFYPTLLYNVFWSKIQAELRWRDEVDQVLFSLTFVLVLMIDFMLILCLIIDLSFIY